MESLSPSFSSRNIQCGSLCARPCAGCGDAERNQTLLLEDSGSGARRTYSTSGQRAWSPEGQDGVGGHRRVERPPLGPGEASSETCSSGRERMRQSTRGAGQRQRGHSMQAGSLGSRLVRLTRSSNSGSYLWHYLEKLT